MSETTDMDARFQQVIEMNEKLVGVLREARVHISALRDEVIGLTNESRRMALAQAVWFVGQEHTEPSSLADVFEIADSFVRWTEDAS